MRLNPHGKLLSDAALGLARLKKRVSNLWAVDFVGIAECEKEFAKIQSKMENLNIYLMLADEELQLKIRNEYYVLAQTIDAYTTTISRAIQEKSWLKKIWSRVQLLASFFGIVRVVLSFFGITFKLLPPADNDDYGGG
jgi:hypothetical protein